MTASALIIFSCDLIMLSGINPGFPRLSLCQRQVTHVLLTRPPLIHLIFSPKGSVKISSLDLHVLSAPPAFVLSQDQTLNLNLILLFSEFWCPFFQELSALSFVFVLFSSHYLFFLVLAVFF